MIFSAELLEVKEGDKEREEALCYGVIKAHERPQNERLGLCFESTRAKFLKLMLLSPRPMATGGQEDGRQDLSPFSSLSKYFY